VRTAVHAAARVVQTVVYKAAGCNFLTSQLGLGAGLVLCVKIIAKQASNLFSSKAFVNFTCFDLDKGAIWRGLSDRRNNSGDNGGLCSF
jgi:hypothetical protein